MIFQFEIRVENIPAFSFLASQDIVNKIKSLAEALLGQDVFLVDRNFWSALLQYMLYHIFEYYLKSFLLTQRGLHHGSYQRFIEQLCSIFCLLQFSVNLYIQRIFYICN